MSHSAGILVFGHAPKLGEPLFAEVPVCFTSPGDVMTFFDELKDLLKGPLDSIPLANAAVYSLGFSFRSAGLEVCHCRRYRVRRH